MSLHRRWYSAERGLSYWCVCVCELETLDLLKELRSCLRPSSMLLPVVEIPEGSWNRSQRRQPYGCS